MNLKYTDIIFSKKFFRAWPITTKYAVRPSNENFIPNGKYFFNECFCVRKECDCRNVKIIVINSDGKVFATISYGWESQSYYRDWGMNKKMAKLMSTPMLCPVGDQSKAAGYFLTQFVNMITTDAEYKERLKRHYFMFRRKVCSESPKLSLVGN